MKLNIACKVSTLAKDNSRKVEDIKVDMCTYEEGLDKK